MQPQTNQPVYRLVIAALFMLLGFGGGVFFTLHEYVIGALFLGFGALIALTSPLLIRSKDRSAAQPPHEYDWNDYYAGRFPEK